MSGIQLSSFRSSAAKLQNLNIKVCVSLKRQRIKTLTIWHPPNCDTNDQTKPCHLLCLRIARQNSVQISIWQTYLASKISQKVFFFQIALALRTLLCLSEVSVTIALLVTMERMVDAVAAELHFHSKLAKKYSQEWNDSMKRLWCSMADESWVFELNRSLFICLLCALFEKATIPTGQRRTTLLIFVIRNGYLFGRLKK